MRSRYKTVLVAGLAALSVIGPTVADGAVKKKPGRFTGGGHALGVAGGASVKVTHGFTLRCRTASNPQRLQVNWAGNRFHLEDLTFSRCDDEGFDQENPSAPIDTYYGSGVGRLNGVPGARASWVLVDDGEPGGGNDRWKITITQGGQTVLTVGAGTEFGIPLTSGNHQAHRCTGNAC